jgi:hypothetical protein
MKKSFVLLFGLLLVIPQAFPQTEGKTEDGNFRVYTDNGFYVKVTNKNSYAVQYSFEYDLTDTKGTVTTYTCENYKVGPNVTAGELFTATNTTRVTRIKLISVKKADATEGEKNNLRRRRTE